MLYYTNQYKKDFKKAKKQGKDLKRLEKIIELLVQQKSLPAKYKEHKLAGDWADYWECHVAPDWLLIYKKTSVKLILVRLGSHSDLF